MLERPIPNENGVLSALPPAVRERLIPRLKRVHLEAGTTLHDVGSSADHAWFITSGIVSLRTITEDGDIIEAAAIGREGIVGLSGITKRNGRAFWAQVQISGEALQISMKSLRNVLMQESAFYKLLFEYTYILSEQIAQAVVCNQFHRTEQRLARWLLMAQDRISSDTMILKHGDMAQMLGVSRSRVSLAAGALQRKGLIHYLRGHIEILNRRGLEGAACECYRAISKTIDCFLTPEAVSVSD